MKLLLALSVASLGMVSASAQHAPPPPAKPLPVPTAAATASPPAKPPVRKRARKFVSPGAARVAAANGAATQQPQAQGFVNAVQVYPFSESMIYQVYTAPGAVTDLALQPGENLVAVAAGDTVRWVIGDTTSGTGADKRIRWRACSSTPRAEIPKARWVDWCARAKRDASMRPSGRRSPMRPSARPIPCASRAKANAPTRALERSHLRDRSRSRPLPAEPIDQGAQHWADTSIGVPARRSDFRRSLMFRRLPSRPAPDARRRGAGRHIGRPWRDGRRGRCSPLHGLRPGGTGRGA